MVHSFIARFVKPRLLATSLLLGVGVTPLEASAAPAWHWDRVVTYVVVADGHVQAAVNINSAVNFISVPVSDAENARRFQDIMTAALLSGRKVNILVDPVNSSSTRGCGNVSNCRIALAYGVTN